MTDRPKRKAIPLAVKFQVADRQNNLCVCGCGLYIRPQKGRGTLVEWDHEPCLRLREIAPDGSDYIPPQHSPDHIDARCQASHHAKTHGTGATTAGTDIGKIAKERRRKRKPKFKRKMPTREFQGGRKFPKRIDPWGKGLARG